MIRPAYRLALAVLALATLPAAWAGEWISDQNGCKAWNGAPAPGESITWSGGCVDGHADGKGTQVWFKDGQRTGSVFTGVMKAGRYNGKGTYIWANDGRYEGDWVDSKATGKGVRLWANGDRYEGDWVDSQQHGTGTYTWGEHMRNCSTRYCNKRYVGEYRDNKRTCGLTEFWDGDSYEGCLEDGRWMPSGPQTKFERAAERRRYERTRNCQHLYNGRVVSAGVVVGFSAERGLATVRDRYSGHLREVACSEISE